MYKINSFHHPSGRTMYSTSQQSIYDSTVSCSGNIASLLFLRGGSSNKRHQQLGLGHCKLRHFQSTAITPLVNTHSIEC